uniref:Cellular nucleic acid-binding protein n=1 Tax=Schistosoma japonicum TaxID=6182 RepID=C1LSV8_SCHJA|nr:cellular nucleic acid-binding protein [Schistosoma japonicum]
MSGECFKCGREGILLVIAKHNLEVVGVEAEVTVDVAAVVGEIVTIAMGVVTAVSTAVGLIIMLEIVRMIVDTTAVEEVVVTGATVVARGKSIIESDSDCLRVPTLKSRKWRNNPALLS